MIANKIRCPKEILDSLGRICGFSGEFLIFRNNMNVVRSFYKYNMETGEWLKYDIVVDKGEE